MSARRQTGPSRALAGRRKHAHVITIGRTNFPGDVVISCPTRPAGVDCNQLSIVAPANSGTLTVNTTSATPISATNPLTISAGGSGVVTVNATATLNVSAAATGNAASWVKDDTETKGNWISKYGQSGYRLAKLNAPADMVIPPGVDLQIAPPPAIAEFEWQGMSVDRSLLRPPSGIGRITSVWYRDGTNFYEINLNLPGGDRQVSLYGFDPDGTRRMRYQILDGDTGALLCNPGCDQDVTPPRLSGGIYLTWNLRGRIKIRVEAIVGNPILNAIFFDNPSSPAPPPPFAVTSNPTAVTFSPSGTQNLTVTLYPGTGFSGNVNFTCAAAPGTAAPAALTCVAPTGVSSQQPQRPFTITAAAGAPLGNYVMRLTGIGLQAQTYFTDIPIQIVAGGVRAIISPEYRQVSTVPNTFTQFVSVVENSSNPAVNWMITPNLGGLTLSFPPSGTGTQTANGANYVFYRPPTTLGALPSQNVILAGTPAVGGTSGSATIFVKTDPYVPPLVCRSAPSITPGCTHNPSEAILPTSISSAGYSYLRLESHYTGAFGTWSDAQLHRTMRVAFALDPANPWDAGATACVIRIERSLGGGGHSIQLDGGTQSASATFPTFSNTSITNGVCTIGFQYTNMSTNFLADPSKAWLDLYLRFNAPSAPRYLFYKIDTFNSTSSGTVLVKDTPLPVVP